MSTHSHSFYSQISFHIIQFACFNNDNQVNQLLLLFKFLNCSLFSSSNFHFNNSSILSNTSFFSTIPFSTILFSFISTIFLFYDINYSFFNFFWFFIKLIFLKILFIFFHIFLSVCFVIKNKIKSNQFHKWIFLHLIKSIALILFFTSILTRFSYFSSFSNKFCSLSLLTSRTKFLSIILFCPFYDWLNVKNYSKIIHLCLI